MAVDKLVDSTQLDTDLSSVADAIRAKGGTSAQLAFPAGFVSAVNAIPTGTTPTGTKSISITENGTTTEDVTNYASAEITVDVSGGTVDGVATATWPSGDITITATTMAQYAFHNNKQITNIYAPNLTSLPGSYQTGGMTSLNRFIAPKLTSLTYSSFREGALAQAIIPSSNMGSSNAFRSCSRLTLIDCNRIDTTNALCEQSPNLATVIIRKDSAVTTVSDEVLYASATKHITFYIPKTLYDHLGDGSALDYQNATNWSVAYTNGYISFACLEGSQYESPTWWQS